MPAKSAALTPEKPARIELLVGPGSLLEKLTRTVVFGAGLAYVIGILVSNEYLATRGASDFSGLKPKCVLTGCWSLAFVFMAASPLYFSYLLLGWKDRPLVSRFGLLIWTILFYATGCLFTNLAAGLLFVFLRVRDIRDVGSIDSSVMVLTATITGIYIVGACYNFAASSDELKFPGPRFTLVLSLIVLLISTWIIALAIYPRVDQGMGGGKPMNAILILNKDGIQMWNEINAVLPSHGEYATTEPLQLLYQNDTSLMIDVTVSNPTSKASHKIIILDRKLGLSNNPSNRCVQTDFVE